MPEFGLGGVRASRDDLARRIEGQIVSRPETPGDRVAALLGRAQELTRGARNPYKNNFRSFLRDLCWTKDEARGGNVAKVPDWPLFDEMAEAFMLCPMLFLEKSRRVMASWVVCCFDIWLAAGGQDPRWPQLMNSDGYRQIIVGSRKFEGLQGSAWFLRSRITHILEQFEKNKCREHWEDFPDWRSIEGRIIFSNGSEITAVAQGADQLRGPGATLVHLEELSFWEQAQSSVEGALPVTRGGGHVIAVTTPNAASYAKRIVDGSLSRTNWQA